MRKLCQIVSNYKCYYSGLSNLNGLGPVPIQISESFGLVNAYTFNGAPNFYLMHLKIAMNMVFRFVRVLIQICEGAL